MSSEAPLNPNALTPEQLAMLLSKGSAIPTNNAAELLLQGFDQDTASVAGPYRSRYHDGYVAWTKGHKIIKEPDNGVQLVEGNGFGCVMLRGNVLKESLFTCRQPPYDFDPAFYERLKQTRCQAKLCWNAECEHLDGTKMSPRAELASPDQS